MYYYPFNIDIFVKPRDKHCPSPKDRTPATSRTPAPSAGSPSLTGATCARTCKPTRPPRTSGAHAAERLSRSSPTWTSIKSPPVSKQATACNSEPEFFNFKGSQRIASKEPIPPGCVAWRAVRQPYSYSIPSLHKLFKNFSTGLRKKTDKKNNEWEAVLLFIYSW